MRTVDADGQYTVELPEELREYNEAMLDSTRPDDEPVIRYLNVYLVERYYGGSEEGGWWYDAGTPAGVSVVVNTIPTQEVLELLDLFRERYPNRGLRYSMAPASDDYIVKLEDHPPKEWPEERPYYE